MTTANEDNNNQKDSDVKEASPPKESSHEITNASVDSLVKESGAEITKAEEPTQQSKSEASISLESTQTQTDTLDQTKTSTQTSDQIAEAQEQEEPKDSNKEEDAIKEEERIAIEEFPELYLNGLYATKLGMSSIYNDQGQIIPVTVLKFDTWRVTQIKTKEKDGYTAIQLGSGPKSERKSNLPQKGHLKPSGFSTNVTFLREIRGEVPSQPSEKNENGAASQKKGDDKLACCQLGQVLSIHSLAKGDRVHLSSISKGRGFTGTMKRLGYGGGPASHGSQFHRKPGSIGMCEEPARVLPGKGMPGHHGDRNVTLKHVEIVDVIPEKRVLLVKGGVPGGRNSLVKLMKESV